MSLGVLTDNLVELYVEGHSLKSTERPQMVANLRGTRLYTETSWLGKAWKWFYKMAAYLTFFRPEYATLKERTLIAAIRHTQSLFRENYQKVVHAHFLYRQALVNRCHLKSINEENVHKARTAFKNWHGATFHWLEFNKKAESKVVIDWIEQALNQNSAKNSFSPINPTLDEAFQVTSKMVALEGYLQEPLSVEVLLKLACDQALDKIENGVARKFVKRVNAQGKAFSIRDFDCILKAIVDGCGSPNADLATLELALTNRGCQLFLQKDQEHLLWREALKPGDKFAYQDRTLTLGEALDKKEDPELDRNVVFEVVEDPSIVLTFGINRAIYGIKDKISKNHSWGLKSVRTLGLDAQRRFAVMPKCQNPLNRIKWESKGAHLSEADLNLAAPIKKLLEWFLGQNKSPFNFSSEDLIFSEKGRIKCLKATLEGPLKFNALVHYAIQCANGNPAVYAFISQPLAKHRFAKFYDDVVSNSLTEVPHEASKIAQVHEIYFKEIVDQAKILQDQLVSLKKKGVRLMKRIHAGKDKEPLFSAEVNQAILSRYTRQNYLGFLPASFEAEVLEELRG